MKLRFWGVRGSVPTPVKSNWRYGGNTCCVEVRLDNGTIIILDGGTGLRALGKSLMAEFAGRPIEAYLFFTHFHWDHIHGIPFFRPLYQVGNMVQFHSSLCPGPELQRILEGQMKEPYFPLEMSAMRAMRRFAGMAEGWVGVNGAVIRAEALPHPQGCTGYRIEADGRVLVFATDTEPGLPADDSRLRALARDADLLVYDSQYTPEQLAGAKRGWGHSSWQQGVQISQQEGVKRLVLFHHDPESDDACVDGLVALARQQFPQTTGAAEGLEFCLDSGEIRDIRNPEG